MQGGGAGGGRRAYSFITCPSRFTVDHAALSRRSTGRAPHGDLQSFGDHYVSSAHDAKTVHISNHSPVSPSVATINPLVKGSYFPTK